MIGSTKWWCNAHAIPKYCGIQILSEWICGYIQGSSYHFPLHILLSESKISRKYIKTAKMQSKTAKFLQSGKLLWSAFHSIIQTLVCI